MSGSPAQKLPQPSKSQLHSLLTGLEASVGDGGREGAADEGHSCSEDEVFVIFLHLLKLQSLLQ